MRPTNVDMILLVTFLVAVTSGFAGRCGLQPRDVADDLATLVAALRDGQISSEGTKSISPNIEKHFSNRPRDCRDLFHCGERSSGVYTVQPRDDFSGDEKKPFKVYCDMITDGGGWMVFQRRTDGSVDFFRNWADYKNGFGFLQGEFWLGLDRLHEITKHQIYELRVDMQSYDGEKAYAKYDLFSIGDEDCKYKLSVGQYNGTAGNGLGPQSGQPFSTKDRDNDKHSGNCATMFSGAWWYAACHSSNLNGLYLRGDHPDIYAKGVNWSPFKGQRHSLKLVEMKIRAKYLVP